MPSPKRRTKPWQLRLAAEEDADVEKLAARRMMSKNDVVRHALRLLVRLQQESEAGSRLLIDRSGEDQVEVWLLW